MTDLNWAYATVRDPLKRELWESDRRRAPPTTPARRPTHGAPRGPLDADGGKPAPRLRPLRGLDDWRGRPPGPRLPRLAPPPRLGCPVSRRDRPDPAGDKGLGAASGAVSALEDHDPPRSVAPPHRIERARDPLEVDPLRDQQVERHAAGGMELGDARKVDRPAWRSRNSSLGSPCRPRRSGRRRSGPLTLRCHAHQRDASARPRDVHRQLDGLPKADRLERMIGSSSVSFPTTASQL